MHAEIHALNISKRRSAIRQNRDKVSRCCIRDYCFEQNMVSVTERTIRVAEFEDDFLGYLEVKFPCAG